MLSQLFSLVVVTAAVLPQGSRSQQCGCGCQSQPQIIRTAPIEIPCQHCVQNGEGPEYFGSSPGCGCQSCQGQNEPRMDTSFAGSVSQMLARILGSLHLSHSQHLGQNEPEEPCGQWDTPQNPDLETSCKSNTHFFPYQSQDTSVQSACPSQSQIQLFNPQRAPLVNTEYQPHTELYAPLTVSPHTEYQLNPELFGSQRVPTITEHQPHTEIFVSQIPSSNTDGQSNTQYSSPQNTPLPPFQPSTLTQSEVLDFPKPLFGNPGQSPVFPSGIIGPRSASNLDTDFAAHIVLPNKKLESKSILTQSCANTSPTTSNLPASECTPSENLEFGVFQRPTPAVHVTYGPDFDEESLYEVKNRSDQASSVDCTNSLADTPQVCLTAEKKYFQPVNNNLVQKPLSGDQFEFVSKNSLLTKPSENDIFSKNRRDKLFP